MPATKLVIAGPKGAGKSAIASFLSGQQDQIRTDKYDATAGVRILEFEATVRGEAVAVELWDASGDHSYENCWKGITQDADGVILVYNPEGPGQDQQIGDWFDFFVTQSGLKDEQCMAIAFRTTQNSSERFRPPPLFSKVTAALHTSEKAEEIKIMFDDFLKSITNYNGQRSRK